MSSEEAQKWIVERDYNRTCSREDAFDAGRALGSKEGYRRALEEVTQGVIDRLSGAPMFLDVVLKLINQLKEAK